jgi:hypothetical protein
MNKKYYYLLMSMLLWVCSGCQEERSIQPRMKQIEIDTVITVTAPTKDTVILDTLNTTPAKRVVRKTTTTKKVIKKVVRPADEVDVDVYPPDPFEDPDYIGTPCGDYVEGMCTRHAQCRKKKN